MKAAKRVAIYARVSTGEQTVQNQLRELREAVKRNGWTVAGEYIDAGISGSKGRDERPQFDRLLKDAVRREFDVVAAWSVDRLGRSLQDLLGFLGEIHSKGIDLCLHQQGIDTTTPAGKAMFSMLGVFGEFERAMIVERIKAGLARAKANGTKSGRPFGRPKVPQDVEAKVRKLRRKGIGIVRISKQVGCGNGTVQRICREMKQGAT